MFGKIKLHFKEKRNKKVDELSKIIFDQDKNIGVRKNAFRNLVHVGNKLRQMTISEGRYVEINVAFNNGHECFAFNLFMEDSLESATKQVIEYLKSL